MDVKSLYTNIPNQEGIQAVKSVLEKSNKSSLTSLITSLLGLILTLNNFQFNDNNYLQINGASMETKCSPTYANVFMSEFEKLFIYPKIKHKSRLYLRYIDDIFLLWTATEGRAKSVYWGNIQSSSPNQIWHQLLLQTDTLFRYNSHHRK